MTKIKKQTTIKFNPPPPQGKAGPSYYPAGVWNVNAVYLYTDKSVPVVIHKGLSYALQDNETTRKGLQGGLEPNQDTNKVNWEYVENLKYVFAEVAFIEFGKLGSSVFNGDFMFSQYGRDGSGKPIKTEGAYKDFTPGNPMGGPFRPNILMNMLTGESWFQNTNVNGNIAVETMTNGFQLFDTGTTNTISKSMVFAHSGSTSYLPPIELGISRTIQVFSPSGDIYVNGNTSNPTTGKEDLIWADGKIQNGYKLTRGNMYTFTSLGVTFSNLEGVNLGGAMVWVMSRPLVSGSASDVQIKVDESLDSESKNPVQNKAVYNKFVDIEKKLGNKIVKVDSAPGSNADPNTLYVITT